MLARYTMHRGPRPAEDPLPTGRRVDTRRHTRHCLRPPRELVDAFLAGPSDDAWARFAAAYDAALRERFRRDPEPFHALAAEAAREDVFLGCSCPTKRNPDVLRCHTVLALRFMQAHFPDLEVRMPTRG